MTRNNLTRSQELFARAERVIPGGVNSPVRAFKAVGGTPLFIQHAEKARIVDVDGNSYIDYVGSWGPLILGHAHPSVVDALCRVAPLGTSYGAPCLAEIELAEKIIGFMPAIEKIRFVSSGTEATMSALRLARGFTGRRKIVKCEGAYHGHSDSLLVAAGSGVVTLGIPGSPGVTEGTAADTLVVPYNDLAAIKATFDQHAGDLAAVIVEPVAGNMGCVVPRDGYLAGLRDLTKKWGALLIFDEVITGFRVGLGGAQGLYGIHPDLTCLGKIIGGGLPVGAYGGRADVMDHVAPLGPVYQAGTLSGNPLAMAAGCATLGFLIERKNEIYEKLETLADRLQKGLIKAAKENRVAVTVNRVGSMLTLFFCPGPVTDSITAKKANTQRYARFFHALLAAGVSFPPAQFEVAFVSAAHTDADIDQTVRVATQAFYQLPL